jgi:hypothetical protein
MFRIISSNKNIISKKFTKTTQLDPCFICLTLNFCYKDKICIYNNYYDKLYRKKNDKITNLNILNNEFLITKKDNDNKKN